MKKRIFLVMMVIFLLVASGLVFAGGQSEDEQAPEAADDTLKAAMLLSGPINDGGWNTSAYEGLVMLQDELGYEIAYTELVKQSEQKNILRNYAKKGYDIIFGHGYEYGDAILEVAAEYPEVAFYNIGGVVQADNVGSGVFGLGELSYLCGKVAALFTKTNKIGFVGAMAIPTIETEVEVIKQTVEEVNPAATVTVAYTGSWTDVNKGKEAALAQIANGVDVIIGIGDACDIGAIKAAEENGTYVVGWSGDFNYLAPETVLTSGVQSVSGIVMQQGEALSSGEWFGESKVFTVDTGVMFMGEWSPIVPEELKAEILSDYEKIKSGEMVKAVN